MADDFQLHILKQGVAAWNKWRAWNPKYRPNLRSADLSGADLRGANLTDANLTDANLAGAIIVGADLERANLTNASFTSANLTDASLWRANLTGAKLRDAYNLTQDQLDFASINTGGTPPALPGALQPPHHVCEP